MKRILFALLLFTGFISFAQFGGLGKKKEAPKTSGGFQTAPKTEIPEEEKTDVYYYNLAQREIEYRGGYNSLVKENIEKAIELNPDNTEYRWIRALCNMTSKTQEPKLIAAVEDINFIRSKGESSSKLYNALALAHSELGEIYRLKKAKQNSGFSDDNSAYIKEQTEYYNEAISHYEKAIVAYNKMVEIKPDTAESVNYKIRDVENYIKEIREKISQLK